MIHTLIRRQRAAMGWGTQQLARAAQTTPAIVEHVEAGRPYPSPAVVHQILTAVGLDPETLWQSCLARLTGQGSGPMALGWLPTTMDVALINVENGGRGHDITTVLDAVFEPVVHPPSVIVVNEARAWREDGGRRALQAAAHLRDTFGPAYQVRVGHLERSDHPPAILWDPSLLELTWWAEPSTTFSKASYNLARFATPLGGSLAVLAQHWHPWSGEIRRQEADCVAGTLDPEEPWIVAGDFNSSPSGRPDLWPDKDWEATAANKRHEKGWQPDGPGGEWTRRTDALDRLIGAYDPATGTRRPGAGLHTVAELDWIGRGEPAGILTQTTTTPLETGGGMVIDHLLVSDALRTCVVPGSYTVHAPTPYSDHRLVTATLGIPQGPSRTGEEV